MYGKADDNTQYYIGRCLGESVSDSRENNAGESDSHDTAVGEDITEHKQAEEALAMTQQAADVGKTLSDA